MLHHATPFSIRKFPSLFPLSFPSSTSFSIIFPIQSSLRLCPSILITNVHPTMLKPILHQPTSTLTSDSPQTQIIYQGYHKSLQDISQYPNIPQLQHTSADGWYLCLPHYLQDDPPAPNMVAYDQNLSTSHPPWWTTLVNYLVLISTRLARY